MRGQFGDLCDAAFPPPRFTQDGRLFGLKASFLRVARTGRAAMRPASLAGSLTAGNCGRKRSLVQGPLQHCLSLDDSMPGPFGRVKQMFFA